MVKRHNNALIVFARDPIVGQVKTRLNSFLDQQAICDLYTCFVSDSLDNICAVTSADHFVGVYPSSISGYFERLDPSMSIRIFTQRGENLGARMLNAFSERFREGYRRVVIIGSDSPSLPLAYILQALSSEKDVALGPSADGGYYLISMRETLVNLFDGVAWGENTVLEETRIKLEESGASLEMLPIWYNVDRAEDLKFLKTHLELLAKEGRKEGISTRKFLKKLSLP